MGRLGDFLETIQLVGEIIYLKMKIFYLDIRLRISNWREREIENEEEITKLVKDWADRIESEPSKVAKEMKEAYEKYGSSLVKVLVKSDALTTITEKYCEYETKRVGNEG